MKERESEVKESVDVCQEDANDDLCPASTEIDIWVNLAPEEGLD
jgi:hypothetical protein